MRDVDFDDDGSLPDSSPSANAVTPNRPATSALSHDPSSPAAMSAKPAEVDCGLDADTDAKLRAALAQLQRQNPQKYAALRQILYEQDPSLPPLIAQSIRDQCIAQLLAPGENPAASVRAAPAPTPVAPASLHQTPAAPLPSPAPPPADQPAPVIAASALKSQSPAASPPALPSRAASASVVAANATEPG
jgi:hypothetical protein